MKLRLKSGGIVKLQNGSHVTDWNNFCSGLNIKRLWIPASESMREQPKTIWDNIKDFIQNAKIKLQSIERPKNIGIWEFAQGQQARVVEHGGTMS